MDINWLPDEVLLEIFHLCCGTLEDLASSLPLLAQVCQRWRIISRDPLFMRLHVAYHAHRSCQEVLRRAMLAGDPAHVEDLTLEGLGLTACPPLLLPALRTLSLGANHLATPPALSGLPLLRELSLEANRLTSLPSCPPTLRLEELRLEFNFLYLAAAPLDFQGWRHLQILDLSSNKLSTFPDLRPLVELRHLSYSHNGLGQFPDLRGVGQLEYLDLSNNEISRVTKQDLMPLEQLEELHLNFNRLRAFPSSLPLDVEILTLKGNLMRSCPDLSAYPLLTCLDLSCNLLTSLVHLESLSQLKYLLLSNNKLTSFPDFSLLPALQFANLRNNRIREEEEKASLKIKAILPPLCTLKF